MDKNGEKMIVIPARLHSTRLKNKILLDIFGTPMFIATAKNASKIDDVIIAVDDENVLKIAKNLGFKAILTKQEHESGTDRINEAVSKLNLNKNEIIINIQADEPFFEAENLAKFKTFATQKITNGAFMASCYKIVCKTDALDTNLVKVVLDNRNFALYFSRSLVPFDRNICDKYNAHIGIYAYSVKNLHEFCAFKPSFLEKTEKLEQLRALQNAKNIAMMEIQTQSIGIDCEEDYKKALEKFKN